MRTNARSFGLRALAVALVMTAGTTSVGLAAAGAATTSSKSATSAASSRAAKPATPTKVVALAQPVSVRAAAELTVYALPSRSAATTVLPATNEFGTRTVLMADARKGAWLQVLLPTRPNGSFAWVPRSQVEVRALHDAVTVDLAARTLTWTRDGVVVLETPVAVGTDDTPTPAGRFSVTDLLDNTDDAGAYGPYALGLAAHSDTLSEFAGGDGQIGLHGTNEPWSIGQAASHGCVRVPNDVVAQLATSLPLGTPVTIR
jgi:lipoprotein-anchoring transpeptidase ErfK/SrfK